MPNDQEMISKLRLAMEQAREAAKQLRAAGYAVRFEVPLFPCAGKENDMTTGINALVERTTREEHKL